MATHTRRCSVAARDRRPERMDGGMGRQSRAHEIGKPGRPDTASTPNSYARVGRLIPCGRVVPDEIGIEAAGHQIDETKFVLNDSRGSRSCRPTPPDDLLPVEVRTDWDAEPPRRD